MEAAAGLGTRQVPQEVLSSPLTCGDSVNEKKKKNKKKEKKKKTEKTEKNKWVNERMK